MTLKDTTSAQGEQRGETYENRAYKFIGKDKYKYPCVFQEVLKNTDFLKPTSPEQNSRRYLVNKF